MRLEFNLSNKSWDFISSSVSKLASLPSISMNASILACAADLSFISAHISVLGKSTKEVTFM